MNSELDKLIESLWEDKERPDNLLPGQIWTVFPSDQPRGKMVLIKKVSADSVSLFHLHHEFDYRRGVDPVLKSEHLNFQDKVVILIDMPIELPQSVVLDGRYIGNLTMTGVDRLNKAEEKFSRASAALTRLNMVQALGTVKDEDEDKSIEEGILELAPIKKSLNEFNQFRMDVSEYFRILAEPQLTVLDQLKAECRKLADQAKTFEDESVVYGMAKTILAIDPEDTDIRRIMVLFSPIDEKADALKKSESQEGVWPVKHMDLTSPHAFLLEGSYYGNLRVQ